MLSYASPIVSAHFVAIGSPLVSFAVSSWDELPPPLPSPLTSLPVAPSIASPTARAVSESTVAWRADYYAFRAARSRMLAGDVLAARAILAGPHGDYVARRFASLARTDERFAIAPVQAPPTVQDAPRSPRIDRPSRRLPRRAPVPMPAPSRTRVDAPEQSTPAPVKPIAPAPVIEPETPSVDEAQSETIGRTFDTRLLRLAETMIGGRLIVNRVELLDALKTVVRATRRGSFHSQMAGDAGCKRIRLWTVGDVLKVGALDDASVPTVDVVQIQIDRPLDVGIVAGDTLQKILQLEDPYPGTLTLEHSAGLHVYGPDSHYKLLTDVVPAKPAADVVPVSAWMTTTAGELVASIDAVAFAASKEGTRYAFNAVCFDFEPATPAGRRRCELVTTDGRRLATTSLACELAADGPTGHLLVAVRDALAIRRALAALQKTAGVRLDVGEKSDDGVRRLAIVGPGVDWRGETMPGTFPPFREVIPTSTVVAYTFEVAELAAGVKRVGKLAAEDSKGVAFAFDVGGRGRVELRSRNPEAGDAVDYVQAKERAGEQFPLDKSGNAGHIGFNPAFILDALKVQKRGKVTLALTAPNLPGLFTFTDGTRYVLMPVNLQ